VKRRQLPPPMKSLYLLLIVLLCAVRSVVSDPCSDAAEAMGSSKFQFHWYIYISQC
jgi:hypothetical protein